MFAQQILLEMDRFLGELRLREEVALQRMQRVKNADGEGRARAQPRPRRQIAVVVDFEPLSDIEKANRFAHGGMLDIPNLMHQFDPRPNDAIIIFEERRIKRQLMWQ